MEPVNVIPAKAGIQAIRYALLSRYFLRRYKFFAVGSPVQERMELNVSEDTLFRIAMDYWNMIKTEVRMEAFFEQMKGA